MLLTALEPLFNQKAPNAVQKKTWERLQGIGLPTKKWETYRYVSLKKLLEQTAIKESQEAIRWSPASDCIILPLERAKESYGPLLERRYAKLLEKENDPFFLLNHTLHKEGIFIYVPPGKIIEEPLSLTFLVEELEGLACLQPKVEIFVGKGASLTTIGRIESKSNHFWNNANMNVTVEEGAAYSHYDITSKRPESWDFLALRAQLKRDSRFHFFSYQRGAQVLRRDLHVDLEGENSEVTLNGVALLDDELEGHVNIRVNHLAPHARSHQFFKNVLSGRARSSFQGKIFVEKEAQKTEAYQLNNNLILSPKSVAFSMPNLEILADDVKASHGATVAQPNHEEIFYLRSRGLSQEGAERHLIRGFCRELIYQIPYQSLQKQLSGDVDVYL